MPSRHLACLLAFLELSGAYVQLDFQKQRVPLSQIHPTIRERHLLRKRAEVVGVTLDNAQNNLLYLVNVTVGSNDQKMALQLDTGSSDIWIPYVDSEICQSSEQPCINGAFEPDTSTTYSDIAPEKFAIQYVDGTEISGDYITDTFSFGGASITKQIMGTMKSFSLWLHAGLILELWLIFGRASKGRAWSKRFRPLPGHHGRRLPKRRVMGRNGWGTVP